MNQSSQHGAPKKSLAKVFWTRQASKLWGITVRFFDFLESKFTRASMLNKAEHFSYRMDGEQHATQTYLAFFRFVSKLIGLISLPVEFVLCALGVYEFPEPARDMVERLVKEGQERALKLKAAQEKQAKEPGKVIGIGANAQAPISS